MQTIAVATGDGIGPEIMSSVLAIFEAAGVPLKYEVVEMGRPVWERGIRTGMTPEAQATVERLGVLLKGPMETPKGTGIKSVNVTARKMWTTFANQRTFKELPGVTNQRPGLNLTMVRENIECTYGAIEHMQTRDVAQCRRLITRPGSEMVIRYTFEMARRKNAKRVTCGHKANIMKMTDGLFLDVFCQVAREYPDLRADDLIVDDMAMKLVMRPEDFDVIVLTNLQGDILSDLCAGLVGGLAYAPSANIGHHICVFEAVHGTAPDIQGKGIANPTALLLSACGMLHHLGLGAWADRIEKVLSDTLIAMNASADNKVTPFTSDRYTELMTAHLAQLAQLDRSLAEKSMITPPAPRSAPEMIVTPPVAQETVGMDLFIDSDLQATEVAEIIGALTPAPLAVVMISNRGTQVWPTGSMFTDCINHHRVRIEAPNAVDQTTLFELAANVSKKLRVASMESLLRIEGKAGYSLAQGQ